MCINVCIGNVRIVSRLFICVHFFPSFIMSMASKCSRCLLELVNLVLPILLLFQINSHSSRNAPMSRPKVYKQTNSYRKTFRRVDRNHENGSRYLCWVSVARCRHVIVFVVYHDWLLSTTANTKRSSFRDAILCNKLVREQAPLWQDGRRPISGG